MDIATMMSSLRESRNMQVPVKSMHEASSYIYITILVFLTHVRLVRVDLTIEVRKL